MHQPLSPDLLQVAELALEEIRTFGSKNDPGCAFAEDAIQLSDGIRHHESFIRRFGTAFAIGIGYLVFRSTFLPRVSGVLLAIGASCYMAYGIADFLAPAFAAHLVPWIQLPSLAGEGSFCLWLMIAGLKVQGWKELAGAAGSRLEWAR